MDISRKNFFVGTVAALAAGAGAAKGAEAPRKIAGFGEGSGRATKAAWTPFTDRKLRVGIAGHGVCKFGGTFGFQLHPNVEVVCVADLQPNCLAELQECTGAKRTYRSCEEMIEKESRMKDGMEAVWIATSAPTHVDLAIMALKHGIHAASAVPAIFGDDQLDHAPLLMDAVKSSGKQYAMFETSMFHHDVCAMRQIYEKGDCGKIVYTEGEYYHFSTQKIGSVGSYGGWRENLPPQWYPTHSNAYYTCVTKGWFTHVVCTGIPSVTKKGYGAKGRYGNPYGSESAFFQTSEGGAARMNVFFDVPRCHGEQGRWWTPRGFTGSSYTGAPPPFFDPAKGDFRNLAYFPERPAVPPQMFEWQKIPGKMSDFFKKYTEHHLGAHPYLTHDFVEACLKNRAPAVDAQIALNTTIAGIYAHRSAMKGGEHLAIPHV